MMADEKDIKSEIDVEELRDRLDAFWEKHLSLLDSYHQAQQQIARHFSSGFFDLAQATFKSTTHVRFGQEYYDDRMQANTRFEASVNDNDISHLALKVIDTPPHSTNDATEKSPQSNKEPIEKEQEDESDEQAPGDTPDGQEQEGKSDDKEKAHNKVRDPLHWYGILVPPSLRASQKSFVSAIHNPVIDAANSAQALRLVDMDIRKLRKDIKKAEKRIV